MREIVNSLVAVVACRFMQDCHAGRYLGEWWSWWGYQLHVPYLRRKLTYIRPKATESCCLIVFSYQQRPCCYLSHCHSYLGNPNIPLRLTSTPIVEYILNINGSSYSNKAHILPSDLSFCQRHSAIYAATLQPRRRQEHLYFRCSCESNVVINRQRNISSMSAPNWSQMEHSW